MITVVAHLSATADAGCDASVLAWCAGTVWVLFLVSWGSALLPLAACIKAHRGGVGRAGMFDNED